MRDSPFRVARRTRTSRGTNALSSVIASAATQSRIRPRQDPGLLRRLRLLAMTVGRNRSLPMIMRMCSRGISCPSDAGLFHPPQVGGRRECRVKASPMARLQQESRRQVPQVKPDHPAFPARWALQLIRTLPGDRAFLPPSPADHHRRLGISVGMPGPYDFTVRNRSFVGMIGSCCDRLRPPRPALNVRDDREAPLLSSTGPNQHSMISEKWKPKKFGQRTAAG